MHAAAKIQIGLADDGDEDELLMRQRLEEVVGRVREEFLGREEL